jgi:YtkA-like
MRVIALLALSVVALFVGTGADAADSRVAADVTCRPGKESLQYDCVIMLTDARTNAPITGVTVSVGADMPSMPLAHNVRPVKAVAGAKPGAYVAQLELEMTGVWALRLDIGGRLRDRVVKVMRFDDAEVAPAPSASPMQKGQK